MIQTIGIYHIGIPVDDLDRAEAFYAKVLGMKVEARIGESGARLSRLKCGNNDVVLFQRPRPLNRNTLKEDGIAHQAFEVAPEEFDEALGFLKREGHYHDGPVVRATGRAVYFFDSEGNYQQIHCSAAGQ
jgi:catechol 2,3-dioxygenase-like lactoylglutathione lyase family enzyme